MIKLVFIPGDSDDQIVIEGEPTEVADAIAAVRSVYVSRETTKPASSASEEVVVIKSPDDRARKIESFLGSLYVYASNRNNDSGRGRWIAEQLMTFSKFDIAVLAKSANSTVDTVHTNIKRLRDGGAVVNVDKDRNTVQVMSFPENKRFIKKRRSPSKVSSSTRQSNSQSLDTSALKGLSL